MITEPHVEVMEPERPPPAHQLSYEEFLEWADEDTRAEWVNGKVQLMSPASLPHQHLSLFLSRLLAEFVETHDAGQVLAAPFQMRLRNVRRGREPDLIVVMPENVSRLTGSFLDGPADLAIEIVSPESAIRDRGEKYAEYEAGGVREYWILDPETRRADFFVLDADGRYQRAHADDGDVYRSTVLDGLWINVGWLWQRPLPPLRQVLQAWQQETAR